jgi:hypothetical protein
MWIKFCGIAVLPGRAGLRACNEQSIPHMEYASIEDNMWGKDRTGKK